MLNRRSKATITAIVCFLVLGISHGSSEAVPLTDGYNKKFYDNFVGRLINDFRKAGFIVARGSVKDTPLRTEEAVVETEVSVMKAPADFKKYFGELKLKNFFVQAEERRGGIFSIDLWVRYESGINYIVFSYTDGPFGDYEKMVGEAKRTLIAYFFGLDCATQYSDGFTQKNDGRLILSADSPALQDIKNFSKEMREFLSSFYKELKAFGFRFTLVENSPVSEIRIFGFPKPVSLFLPEPETKLIVVKSKKTFSGADISVFDRVDKKFSDVAVVNFASGEPIKKLAEYAVKKIFYSLA